MDNAINRPIEYVYEAIRTLGRDPSNNSLDASFEPCSGCGDDHDPEDCIAGFNDLITNSEMYTVVLHIPIGMSDYTEELRVMNGVELQAAIISGYAYKYEKYQGNDR